MSITALQVVEAPGLLPVSLKEAKRHLRITHSVEDANISDLIKAATSWAEEETRRRIIEQTVTLSMDRFPRRGEFVHTHGHAFESIHFSHTRAYGRQFEARARDRAIFLPGGVTTAVNKIDYVDELGAPQSLTGPTSPTPGTDYQEDLSDDEGGWVTPARDAVWPAVAIGEVNAVVIEFKVGYSDDPDGVPDILKQAIKFRIGDLFNVRSTTDGKAGGIGDTASNLLEPFRIQMF
jgi:hypothetical protein